MFEKMIHNTEELNAMAVHLRLSQNFSELKSLAAKWLVPEDHIQDFISGKELNLQRYHWKKRNILLPSRN